VNGKNGAMKRTTRRDLELGDGRTVPMKSAGRNQTMVRDRPVRPFGAEPPPVRSLRHAASASGATAGEGGAEGFFAKLTRRWLKRGVFKGVADLHTSAQNQTEDSLVDAGSTLTPNILSHGEGRCPWQK